MLISEFETCRGDALEECLVQGKYTKQVERKRK